MLLALLVTTLLICAPALAEAHEVYVLPPDVIAQALATPSFSLVDVMLANKGAFTFWALITVLVVCSVFAISISRRLEKLFHPFLIKLPQYAPAIGRIGIGLSFLAAGYFGALFGPELPLQPTFGMYTQIVTALLVITGVLITIGLYTRLAAVIVLVLFGIEVATHGTYMITYTNYIGELIVLLVLGAHSVGFEHKKTDARKLPHSLLELKRALMPYMFPFLRIAFGVSLIFASVYAKVLHNNLALAVTAHYPGMVAFFGFEPHFLVLGAAIIEIVLGIFFVLGIEIRFTSLFILFWLSLSLWYFGESVWPHIILISIPLAFVFYGYDRYSLEGMYFKKHGREPVL